MTTRLRVVLLLPLVASLIGGTATAQSKPGPLPFEITDNSFLVEEAFNQEPRVFQNIATFMRDEHGAWEAGFTQEWPLASMRHQLSYTLPFSGADGHRDFGAAMINYRYQLLEESSGRPAVSPRVSLILPTGARDSIDDRTGVQFNLPVSKQRGDLYFHGNAGLTWLPNVPVAAPGRDKAGLTSPHVSGSVIWRTRPLFHLMLESVLLFDEGIDGAASSGTSRSTAFTVSPGARHGWNIGDQQVVAGLATPFTRQGGSTTFGVLAYFSYELPF